MKIVLKFQCLYIKFNQNAAILTYFHDFYSCFNGSYIVAAEVICSENPKIFISLPLTEVCQPLPWPVSGHTVPAAPRFSPNLVALVLPSLALPTKSISWLCFYYSLGYPSSPLQNLTFTFLPISLWSWPFYPLVFPVPWNQKPYQWLILTILWEQRGIYSGIMQSAISVVISRLSKFQSKIRLLDFILKIFTFHIIGILQLLYLQEKKGW